MHNGKRSEEGRVPSHGVGKDVRLRIHSGDTIIRSPQVFWLKSCVGHLQHVAPDFKSPGAKIVLKFWGRKGAAQRPAVTDDLISENCDLADSALVAPYQVLKSL